MENGYTLVSMFESNKDKLEQELKDLVLPQDTAKVQKIVNDYFNVLFDSESEYRQNLTQAEDYMLQAALSLLNAQQAITKEVTPNISFQQAQPQIKSQTPMRHGLKKEQYPMALVGTAVGSGLGGVVFGTWGAVFGAIAGTAVVLYCASSMNSQPIAKPQVIEQPKLLQAKLNVDVFLFIIKNICKSVDSLIDTFRAQINRVVHKYESQEKPTLEKEYHFLLEGIQSVIGYKRAHSEEDKFLKKVQERIEDMAELLDNYNLTVEDYTEEHKHWFDVIENPNTTELTQILPAIVKCENVVLKGRILVPEN
ncbi:glycine zipper family protein [Phocaeicola vulgatus]|jgi:hypothetical protein|uniref:Uncharacterized protein n=1 Tax=Phocaeicola vulgatus TaxID=821 RepID=A0A412QHE2_PHOVU|nr:glycine zipper family protein [Phocaeicola vulgatus]MCG0155596.1 hypothetical protein [Phocaeicola vulgatus]MCG0329532.1 hypothetical protein [Phocaeicola vulgatus]MCG0333417.1 hypothetical protein [Phocaeicola vulgatus]RGT90353.1 hypothetical protein DWX04_15210 [Phocaeicola vulgatus]